jgi:hypothetical protein
VSTFHRLQASIGVGVAAICAACLILGAPALAASRSASELRRAFAQTLIALRSTGNAAACSATTPEGKIALIEMLRGEERYLPSTTCTEAFAGRVSGCGPSRVELLTPRGAGYVIQKAVIHVRGNRGTVQLVDDFFCESEDYEVAGPRAVRIDPMGTSHWLRKRGRWLFDNRPTGTYSRAGRKAVAMLRAALSGRVVTHTVGTDHAITLTVPFCTNGTTQPISTITGEPVTLRPVLWYVAAGGLTTSEPPEPPFDAQGDPQGLMSLNDVFVIFWNVKLVGGVLTVTEPLEDVSLPVGAPGTAGC